MIDFNDELNKLRAITNEMTDNGYLIDRAAQWESALDAVPDLIFIINPEYRIKYINVGLAKQLNVNKFDVIDNDCCTIMKDETHRCLCHRTIFQNESASLDGVRLEDKLKGWYDFTKSPIFDEDNRLLGYICVLRDVTERKKLEAGLRDSLVSCEIALEGV